MRSKRPYLLAVLALCAGLVALTAQPAVAQGVTDPPTQLLERSGAVTIKVKDYDAARQRALDSARALGAEVLSAKTTVNFQGKKAGFVTIRIDSNRLPDYLPLVLQSGKLYADKITSRDHISEYEELARRTERLKEHEQRLANFLQSPRRMRGSDIMYLQERLYQATVDQSLMEQRRIDLARAARTSTITVQLFESMPPHALDLGNRYAGSMLRAHESLESYYQKGFTATAFAVTYAPFWVPALVLAILLLVVAWRLRLRAWAFVVDTATRLAPLMMLLFRALLIGLTVTINWLRLAWDAAGRRGAQTPPTIS